MRGNIKEIFVTTMKNYTCHKAESEKCGADGSRVSCTHPELVEDHLVHEGLTEHYTPVYHVSNK